MKRSRGMCLMRKLKFHKLRKQVFSSSIRGSSTGLRVVLILRTISQFPVNGKYSGGQINEVTD